MRLVGVASLVAVGLLPAVGVAEMRCRPSWAGVTSRPSPAEPQQARGSPGPGVAARNRRAMLEWSREYRRSMAPVAGAWSRLSRAIHERPSEALGIACARFAARLEALDDSRILPAPDPAISLHLSRGLLNLRRAAARCRQQRLFALAGRLAEARRALLEVDRLTRHYRLPP